MGIDEGSVYTMVIFNCFFGRTDLQWNARDGKMG